MEKKLRVLQVASAFAPLSGGTEKVVAKLSQELVKKGHAVTILTTNLYVEQHEQARIGTSVEDGVRVVRLPNRLFLAGYGFSPAVLSWLSRNWQEYDVVHVHGYNRFATEFALFFLKNKVPVVFTAHGFYHTASRRLLKQLHRLVLGSFAARCADACVAITQDDVQEFAAMGVRREKITVISNGVEVEKFGQKSGGKTKNSFEKYSPYVLFVGRLHASKGLQFLAPAVKELPCKLVVVGGDAGFEKKLRERVSSLAIESKVVFAGQLDEKELVQAYQACEMLVLPSEWEAFGVVLVEAMAAGKPVIGSNRGAIPHLVKEGENGFLVPYGDVVALRQKIALLLNDKKRAGAMGARGKKFARQFSWKSVAEKTVALYEKLCRK